MRQKRLYFYLGLLLYLEAVQVLCFVLQSQQLSKLKGIGITSIIPVPNVVVSTSVELFVGTKRGNIIHVVLPLPPSPDDSVRVNTVSNTNTSTETTLKPYPVYSMDVVTKPCDNHSGEFDLLTGGGDRYVTVWELKGESALGGIEIRQQLGPHTGWVKDLVSLPYKSNKNCNEDSTLFSIGCNCIEVWVYTKENYKHMCKLQIESSVEMGSTLSSDLLCLATYHCDDTSNSYLLAGGVDGRLHRLKLELPNSIDNMRKVSRFINAGVVGAHNGRLNKILVCNNFGALVSVGADGVVACRMITNYKPLDGWETSKIEVSIKSDDKLTSSCVVDDGLSRAIIAVGTSSGKLVLVQIVRTESNAKLTLLESLHVTKDENNPSTIHAMCSFKYNQFQETSSYLIAIGHSHGLSICTLNI
jgi:hypothetical protein